MDNNFLNVTMNVETMLMIGVVAVLSLAMIVLAVKQRKLQKTIEAQNAVIAQHQENIRALFSGAAGVGQHLANVEHVMRRIIERQDRLDLKDSSNQSYEHAIRLIQNGANLDEIIANCGLVREEAELLSQMYRYEKAG